MQKIQSQVGLRVKKICLKHRALQFNMVLLPCFVKIVLALLSFFLFNQTLYFTQSSKGVHFIKLFGVNFLTLFYKLEYFTTEIFFL